jgi:hypothetical protein
MQTTPVFLIEKAGFVKNEAYAGEVYMHGATEMLLLVKDSETLVISDNSNIVSTIQNDDHFSMLGTLLHLSDSHKITPTSFILIPIFSGIR